MTTNKVIYKEESYRIVGCCFEIFNILGAGHREKTYQKALEEIFQLKKIDFKNQVYIPIKISEKIIDKHFLDFVIYDKIALEIKTGDHFHKRDIIQLHSYLKSGNLKLGIFFGLRNCELLSNFDGRKRFPQSLSYSSGKERLEIR